MAKDQFKHFIGVWKYTPPWDDSDDCRSEYTISGSAENPLIEAIDFYDGERFVISNISWDGNTLKFESFMESTGRKGINKLTLDIEGQINNEYTFTESSKLTKID